MNSSPFVKKLINFMDLTKEICFNLNYFNLLCKNTTALTYRNSILKTLSLLILKNFLNFQKYLTFFILIQLNQNFFNAINFMKDLISLMFLTSNLKELLI